jgi:tetratricopeptide (TPR) repeat protein
MTLEDALAHFRAGRWADARRAAEEITARDPQNAAALHVAAAASAQLGEHDRAIADLRRATQADPNLAVAWLDLALVLEKIGRVDGAIDALARVALLQPDAPRLKSVADALFKRRRFSESVDFYRRAVALAPHDPDLHNRLASALLESNDPAGGEAAARQALHLAPDHAAALFNLGSAAQKQDRLDEAVECYRKVIALKPRFALAYCNLGVVLQEQNRIADATDAFRKAAELNPKLGLALSNLGHMLALVNHFDEAEQFSRRAVELEPNNPTFLNNFSTVLGRARRFDEAVVLARRAIEIDPHDHRPHAHLGLLLLHQGRLREGFSESEWRVHEWTTPAMQTSARPTWDGSPLNGRTLLLRAEQGFGDTIHYIRYAQLVHEQRLGDPPGRIIVECPVPLKDLVKTARGVDAVHAWGETAPAADVEIWMMSLPHRFGTTSDTIPADVPYLFPVAERLEKFATLVRDAKGLKVGLNWAGNPDYLLDATRSTSLSRVAPLLEVARGGVTWFSIQKGKAYDRDAALIKEHNLVDAGPMIRDFADTAALMSQLDLVITTDTAPAHLAGAMARPTWVLLEFHPEWRWLHARERNPWYPTIRVFQQPAPGDWDSVVADVCEALKIRVKEK